ncbi:L-threonine 3-dehydrogenase [Actinocatenispora thailandica]|uniref:L-threonine 3-dehydrogenase n=1 Tax=Actinocatenispora thailandica TaxID=227318 RepID=A0A7R7HXX3_9ACTN|nr:L-threonine 3-dehydrogenase [Actinocatenispora thailandica]BCJ36667.1 L-threonine 3-dehydrogenase [Actinocatenispora thailandica]
MKALVKAAPEAGLQLLEVPEPTVGPTDVKIRVLRTGLCGTDLHIEAWDDWAKASIDPPLVVGHEFAGEVVEVGPSVTTVSVGDLVSGEGHLVCGRCRNCRAGRRHLCIRTVGLGVQRDGAFAEFLTLPESNVWVHGRSADRPVDLDVAAIFDPFGNAVHTAMAFEVFGEDVLITGAGPIGIMAAAVVRHAGARHVVITDVSDYRLRLAEKVGVSLALDVSTTPIERAQAMLGMREGFDVGLEMSGQPSALREMISNMTHGGRIAMLGLPSTEIAVDWNRVVTHMLTIKGIYGREMFETWYRMSVLLERGLDLSPVITGRYGYTQYAEAFAEARSGNCGKIVLDWTCEKT